MIFNSSLFLLYFLPCFLVIYYLVGRSLKNWLLLVTGILFYAWGAPKFVFFVMGAVVIDFYLAGAMNRKEGTARRLLMWASVALNLGLLLWFKYMNFFVEQFSLLWTDPGTEPSKWVKIALPVGISFITFQKLAYTLDVYKRHQSPFARLQDFALYIFLFPQILSGPIVRPGQIAGQIADRSGQMDIDAKLSGFYRFMIGLAKKVLIADVLGVTVNEIFALQPENLSTSLAWTGAVAYTFQIYFDFSGYSDMAIGLARMLGFRLPENFNFPYISGSITEFWRRWHITLSLWFRDYVFLPLAYATSRKMPAERYLGLRADKVIYLIATTITFLLCGFWHGAAWTFIAWGGYMGLFLVFDRLFLLRILKKAGKIPAMLFTFLLITIGWVLFRSETLAGAWHFLSRMFEFTGAANMVNPSRKFWTLLVMAALFSFWGAWKNAGPMVDALWLKPGNRAIVIFSIAGLLLFVLNLATITSAGFSPFIYFRF
ncbi:MAG TPA: MBOAT family O-acyltransferase [Bacteroidales bacterium]|nr:MBOAT family O-acyltransferase [Bacteroidales bacterium]